MWILSGILFGLLIKNAATSKLIFKLIFEIDLFLYNSRILYTLSIEEELLNEFFLGSSILNSKNSSWYCYHDKNRLKNEQCQLKLQLSFIKKIKKRGYRLFWPLDSKNWISIFWHHTVPKSCIEVNLIFWSKSRFFAVKIQIAKNQIRYIIIFFNLKNHSQFISKSY